MTLTIKSFLGVLLMVGGCWFYFMVMSKIGFLIITPIFLILLPIYALGLKSWWKCIMGVVVMTAIVYAIFSLLGLKLPPGILSGILPF